MRGYSQSVIEANQLADPSNIGVVLGTVCISQKYPIAAVAKELEISRQAVYHYFSGNAKPVKEKELLIRELIQRLTAKA
jgi:predicted transcriptional regulator